MEDKEGAATLQETTMPQETDELRVQRMDFGIVESLKEQILKLTQEKEKEIETLKIGFTKELEVEKEKRVHGARVLVEAEQAKEVLESEVGIKERKVNLLQNQIEGIMKDLKESEEKRKE
jgi:hypothetical protein